MKTADNIGMEHRPDYILDLSSAAAGEEQQTPPVAEGAGGNGVAGGGDTIRGKSWIAVHWRCCNVYNRLYKNAQGTAYTGRCPRCGRSATANVGTGGTDQRFFSAG